MQLREFVEKLDRHGLLTRMKKEVNQAYEMASLMRKLDRRPVLFENVKGYAGPVAANVCSRKELVAMGLGVPQNMLITTLTNAINNPKKPSLEKCEYQELGPDLGKLPNLLHYRKDGGPYIASAIAIAQDKELGLNASYHRAMILGHDRMVLRILPRHFNTFIERGLREFAFCIGPAVQVQVAAAISCELGTSELAIANALKPTPLVEVGGHLVPESEFVIIAEFTGEEAEEGPFVDLTGTYDAVRKQRVVRVKNIFAKPQPLFHALLPGGNEHRVLMGMPREPTIFREVNRVAHCLDASLSSGGCSWLHGVVKIKKQRPDDGKKAIEAAFKGHPSMKHVFVVDEDVDIYNPADVEWALATRFQGDRDLVVKPGEKGSSLDPSSSMETRETTKVGFDLTIPEGNRKDFVRAGPAKKVNPEDYL